MRTFRCNPYPHTEKHFTASAVVRDIVIGMADGLTVPFALAAGLTGAIDSTGLIITAGLAEVAAGAIAMGLGGYLAARTDVEHYASERAIEEREVDEIPEREAEEVATVFRAYDLDEPTVQRLVSQIRSDRTRWVDFMMKFESRARSARSHRARVQCPDDRRILYRGEVDPALTLLLLPFGADWIARFGGRDGCRAGPLRLHQGSVHGHDYRCARVADGGRGLFGRRRRLYPGPLDRRIMSNFSATEPVAGKLIHALLSVGFPQSLAARIAPRR